MISVHDLCHTYASMLFGNWVDFKTVAELMGDTVKVIIDTCSHFTWDMMANAKKAVNNIFKNYFWRIFDGTVTNGLILTKK